MYRQSAGEKGDGDDAEGRIDAEKKTKMEGLEDVRSVKREVGRLVRSSNNAPPYCPKSPRASLTTLKNYFV